MKTLELLVNSFENCLYLGFSDREKLLIAPKTEPTLSDAQKIAFLKVELKDKITKLKNKAEIEKNENAKEKMLKNLAEYEKKVNEISKSKTSTDSSTLKELIKIGNEIKSINLVEAKKDYKEQDWYKPLEAEKKGEIDVLIKERDKSLSELKEKSPSSFINIDNEYLNNAKSFDELKSIINSQTSDIKDKINEIKRKVEELKSSLILEISELKEVIKSKPKLFEELLSLEKDLNNKKENVKLEDLEKLRWKIINIKLEYKKIEERDIQSIKYKQNVKVNNLAPNEIEKLDNEKLLSLNKDKRLEYVTLPTVNYNDVANWDVTNIKFFFNSKNHKDLYLKTTAWQVLPPNVREVEVWWKTYSRTSLYWEFFNEDWKRLIIKDGTKISIKENQENIETIKDENKKKADDLVNTDVYQSMIKSVDHIRKSIYREIVEWAIDKWIDPNFAITIFWDKLKSIKDPIERKIELEDMLTEFDRVRWITWASAEYKNWKYDIEIASLLARKYHWDKWENTLKNMHYKPEEIKSNIEDFGAYREPVKNSKLDVNNLPKWVDWLLNFICIAEWSCPKNSNNINYNTTYSHTLDWEKISEKSILEVYDIQKRQIRATRTSTYKWTWAVWAFQFTQGTLKLAISSYWINENAIFDEKLQRRLAVYKLEEKWLNKFIANPNDPTVRKNFITNLSNEWASIPKNASWKWAYDLDWVNYATVTYNDLNKVLNNI